MEKKHKYEWLPGCEHINAVCVNCGLNWDELSDKFHKLHTKSKPHEPINSVKYINDWVPCLTEEEWLIKELLE